MRHNEKIRVSIEMAMALNKLGFQKSYMEDWEHHFYIKRWQVREDAFEKFGELSDDGFWELTEDAGGKYKFEDIYEKKWRIGDFYPMDGEEYYICPTIYEVQTWLRDIFKRQITVYSCSQESWMYRITLPHEKLEDGVYGEDFSEFEDALKDAIQYIINQLINKEENGTQC